jgi:hypothetical protein
MVSGMRLTRVSHDSRQKEEEAQVQEEEEGRRQGPELPATSPCIKPFPQQRLPRGRDRRVQERQRLPHNQRGEALPRSHEQ